MATLLIAIAAGLGFIVAYHTYGRWLGGRIFNLSAEFVCPSTRLRDDKDYVPTPRAIVFGHHFTSIAGTGPIVGPAIAVMWGWLPALLWVVFGSIFIGAVHDFGALVVSLRNNGQTVGDIAGRVLNRRVRLLFLFVLFLALTIVLAIFGLVIAAVFRQYPSAIFPCLVQIPIAVVIGLYLHRRGVNLTLPSLIALAIMYVTVIFGDRGVLGDINAWLAGMDTITWVIVLLVYSYVASVLPVWMLLQPRDYINSLQLLTALGLIVVGLCAAAFVGGAPPVPGAERQPLEIVAPMVNWDPSGAPLIFPFLFITIACGAISGFHCLVSSGTSSKQLQNEPDARFVGYGGMLTEGFLATLVILACVAGLGLGIDYFDKRDVQISYKLPSDVQSRSTIGSEYHSIYRVPLSSDEYQWVVTNDKLRVAVIDESSATRREFEDLESHLERGTALATGGDWVTIAPNIEVRHHQLLRDDAYVHPNVPLEYRYQATGELLWTSRYYSWNTAGSLGAKVGAFVDGSANFLKTLGIPASIAIALMGVLVASFAGTTLDTACRLQRYVVQELAATLLPQRGPRDCVECGYDLTGNVSGACPECGWAIDPQLYKAADGIGGPGGTKGAGSHGVASGAVRPRMTSAALYNPLTWLANKHGATIFAVVVAVVIAALPTPGSDWSWVNAGKGGLILWPMFGATNQLLGGLAFLVIGFYLWRRGKPVWFLVLPMLFMLIMPAWAMTWQLFIGSDEVPAWVTADEPNWLLIGIAIATLALEAWMLVEAVLLWPRVRGVLEPQLPGSAGVAAAREGVNC